MKLHSNGAIPPPQLCSVPTQESVLFDSRVGTLHTWHSLARTDMECRFQSSASIPTESTQEVMYDTLLPSDLTTNSSEKLVLLQPFCGLPRSTEKISLHTRVFLRQQETCVSEVSLFPKCDSHLIVLVPRWKRPVRLLLSRDAMNLKRPESSRPSDHPLSGGMKCVSCHQNSPRL
uniref:Uncharacterized protein n=1 Tax=Molossus molossus TaxID=27622 RepID=A0A7J8JW22_MOLMO|nr:hypothetical protein HJG59_008051 [Molossus molossus]